MSKNKQCPEHCTLGSPVQRPNQPAMEVNGSHCQPQHYNNIPQHITHRPPWILDPTVFRDRCSNISNSEGRGRTGIKFISSTKPISRRFSFSFFPLSIRRVLSVCNTKKEGHFAFVSHYKSQTIQTQEFITISREKQTSVSLTPKNEKPSKEYLW